MSREVYERLLAECRKEWIVAGNQTFNMNVFAPSSHSTSNPPFNRDTHELLANVNVPMDSDRSCFTLDAFAVMEKVKRTDRTRKVFTRLCNKAGAHLPPEFETRLCDYCTWDKRCPASRWIALMLHLEGEVACNPDGTYREQLVITQPFRAYVDVIQICRLHTDQPVFPEVIITDEGVTVTTPDSHVPVDETHRRADVVPQETSAAIERSTGKFFVARPPGDKQPEPAQDATGDDPDASQEAANGPAIVESLQPAERKAYFAYQLAESKAGRSLEDHEAYDRIREVDFTDDTVNWDELANYDPPSLETWSRQLRVARKAMDDQKYTRRAGRATGGSVVRQDEI